MSHYGLQPPLLHFANLRYIEAILETINYSPRYDPKAISTLSNGSSKAKPVLVFLATGLNPMPEPNAIYPLL